MTMAITNKEIAKIFYEIADILEIQNVAFKPRAYQKAAMNIETIDKDLREIYREGGEEALDAIPGVGESIKEKIIELLRTGRLKYYQNLKKKFPLNIEELTSIEGLGPKIADKLYRELGIKNLRDLERAARAGKIRRLEHFGERTEQNILRGLEFLKKSKGRMLLSEALPVAEKMIEALKKIPGAKKAVYAGSLRRMQETIGDIDILATSDKPQLMMEAFVNLPEVKTVYSHGATRSSARLKIGCDADLRVVKPEVFGAALQYFTGDKTHNIEVRKIAGKLGYKLNEYGLWRGKKLIACETEEEIYKKLGMDLAPPEIRTCSGEIEAAKNHTLPRLISYDEIVGDLQVQTDWSDGASSIEEMAREAQKLGFQYMAVTDHTKALAMTGGLNEQKLARQGKEIDKLNKKFKNFKILKSAEINILKDGSLDIKNEALKKLDIVSAAVHSNFKMSKDEMTRRIVRAISHPYLNILFHPTGRIISRRESYEIDIDEVIKAAKKYGVALEIDAYPNRLDLKDEYIRKAVAAGVKLVIDTDAHQKQHLGFMKFGLAQARRGWAKKSDILNTQSADKLLKSLRALKKK